jgi:hypothetical protein
VVEEGGVPVAFEDAASHEGKFSALVEGEGFHEAFADFTICGGAFFFGAVVPGEPVTESQENDSCAIKSITLVSL